jgi:hypothetical protein
MIELNYIPSMSVIWPKRGGWQPAGPFAMQLEGRPGQAADLRVRSRQWSPEDDFRCGLGHKGYIVHKTIFQGGLRA